MSTRERVLALLAGALVTLSATVSLGRANHDGDFPEVSYPYTQKGDGDCRDDAKDPVTIIFRGPEAGVPNTVNQIERHSGWENGGGAAQNLRVRHGENGYRCDGHTDQRSSGGNTAIRRFHTRLWRIPYYSDQPHKRTVADPHHEEIYICGHVVHTVDHSGFVEGRDELLGDFAEPGTHDVDYGYWGNTRLFQQCDYGFAGSGGGGFIIYIDHQ